MMTSRILKNIAVLALLVPIAGSIGCDDPTAGLFDPQIVEDTVEFWLPDPQRDDLPTALDVSASPMGIAGARFPETMAGANNWDVTVRMREGALTLVTPGGIGLDSRAGLAEPVTDRSIEEVDRAPVAEFTRDRTLPLAPGTVYLVRTRARPGCQAQFSKITPVEIDAGEGRVAMRVITNARCGDDRLVP